jgi:hypothetical protein
MSFPRQNPSGCFPLRLRVFAGNLRNISDFDSIRGRKMFPAKARRRKGKHHENKMPQSSYSARVSKHFDCPHDLVLTEVLRGRCGRWLIPIPRPFRLVPVPSQMAGAGWLAAQTAGRSRSESWDAGTTHVQFDEGHRQRACVLLCEALPGQSRPPVGHSRPLVSFCRKTVLLSGSTAPCGRGSAGPPAGPDLT